MSLDDPSFTDPDKPGDLHWRHDYRFDPDRNRAGDDPPAHVPTGEPVYELPAEDEL